mmetsp:Transcript_8371/g.27422  ORF Transcript_8371/g.27422 Transcript_8371/m.27422 type:complete len:163 (+) Transcript_8371:1668-2156(+)
MDKIEQKIDARNEAVFNGALFADLIRSVAPVGQNDVTVYTPQNPPGDDDDNKKRMDLQIVTDKHRIIIIELKFLNAGDVQGKPDPLRTLGEAQLDGVCISVGKAGIIKDLQEDAAEQCLGYMRGRSGSDQRSDSQAGRDLLGFAATYAVDVARVRPVDLKDG